MRRKAFVCIIVFIFFTFTCSLFQNKENNNQSIFSLPDNPPKQTAILNMPYISTDVSRELQPFSYILSLKQAGINFYGAEKVFWNDLEPGTASGFQWTEYDAMIKKIEAEDSDVLPTIWCVSSWATEKPSHLNPSSAPKKEYQQRYVDFIKAFIERYDGDGKDDMPGLSGGHHYLQIEDEAQNIGDSWNASSKLNKYKSNPEQYYRYTAQEYGEMLKLAYTAAHEADPKINIISFTFNFGDYFNTNPATVLETNPRFYFLDEIFTNYHQYFDIIGVQANYDYSGIPGTMHYLRSRYKLDKPIICADAASMPMLGQNQFQKPNPYEHQFPFLTDSEILKILDTGSTHKRYQEIKTWWEKEKSILCVKKAVVSAAVGAEQISFQFIQTWNGSNNVWLHSDLLSAGPDFNDPAPKGTPWAVIHALGQLNKKVADFTVIEDMNPLPPGKDPYSWIWMYRWDNEGKFTYIAWCEKEGQQIDLSDSISSDLVTVTPVISEIDSDYNPIIPPTATAPAKAVPIGRFPVYIEE